MTMLCCGLSSFSQIADVNEKKPAIIDGIEYGYYIKNEQTKSVKDEEYGRFERRSLHIERPKNVDH